MKSYHSYRKCLIQSWHWVVFIVINWAMLKCICHLRLFVQGARVSIPFARLQHFCINPKGNPIPLKHPSSQFLTTTNLPCTPIGLYFLVILCKRSHSICDLFESHPFSFAICFVAQLGGSVCQSILSRLETVPICGYTSFCFPSPPQVGTQLVPALMAILRGTAMNIYGHLFSILYGHLYT